MVVGALLASTAAASPAQAAPPPPSERATVQPKTITLITGDRVRVTPRPGKPEEVVFEPTPTSRSTSAITTYSGGHTYVVPSAARADVLSGRLDRTLFDVTTLIAEGRDDASSKTLPVIVRYAGTPAAATTRARQAQLPGTKSSRVLTSIGARAAAVDKSSTDDFWATLAPGSTARVNAAVQRVSLDRQVRAGLDQSVPQIGGPAAWQRGFTGKGTKIAVLDTGLDPTHPDLAGRIAQSENFSEAADAVDHFGHGTHVASIAAGSGAASGGKYKGVAHEATLLNAKVLDDFGSGYFSGIIAGMEWAAAQGADVANLSLGSADPSDGTDDLSLAVNRLTQDTGTLFVVAAGNCFFPQPATVTSPAAADDALAVGNLQRDGSLNDSSCRGPRKGDGALKPEISAPGTDIVAARAAGTSIGDPVGDSYTTLTGTSMATPHVAGTAALVAQAHPDWKATQLKARLISTADPQQARVDEEGAGRVDADQATEPAVTVDLGELELGTLLWPYPAKDEVSRDLTYRNPTGTPVTLQLAASLDPAQATPKLSATQLVVPANGEAKVTVTADRAAAGTGTFSGRITATAAGADPIVTTIGWFAEAEMYDLTLKGITRAGGPANADITIARLDGAPLDLGPFGLPMRDGVAKVRVPPGRYVASTFFGTPATDTALEQFDLVAGDEVNVTQDSTVTLDARKAEPVDLTAEGTQDLTSRQRSMVYVLRDKDGRQAGGIGLDLTGSARVTRATPTSKVSTGNAEFALGTRLEVPPYRAKVQGGSAFTVLDYYFGPRFTGTKKLALYDAGAGSAEELKGTKGKLALIRRGTSDPRYNGEIVKAAEDAGAAAVLLYNPEIAGDGGVNPYWATGDSGAATIPAMRTSRAAAQLLLDRPKPVTVELTGQATTPYVYDLMQPWTGQVPAVGKVVVPRKQLATVTESFGSHKANVPTSEVRHGSTPGGGSFGSWLVPTFSAPSHRTSYVQAGPAAWSSSLIYNNGDANFGSNTTERSYRPGERASLRFLAPVQNSGLPVARTNEGSIRYVEGGLLFQVSPFQSGVEFADTYRNTAQLTVERDGELLASAEDTGLWVETPTEPATYRATLLAERNHETWLYSTKVRSVWSWKAKGGEDEVMPVVFADLDVPSADQLSRVRTGVPTQLTLGLRHQAESGSTAKFTSAKLELSYDGKKWTELKLAKHADGRYSTTVTHPAAQAGKKPSLRLTAVDADGNKLEQEVTSAYGLIS
ncbi:S8 family peptidase [Kribbella amoyensis]|uniref:S8 family peptidase n=1 Tax=Kribbella amoyensis TaxID=996641 RepID=UPI001EE2300E|nr:S8 family serine peptidase [Kribbella amoyensis]